MGSVSLRVMKNVRRGEICRSFVEGWGLRFRTILGELVESMVRFARRPIQVFYQVKSGLRAPGRVTQNHLCPFRISFIPSVED